MSDDQEHSPIIQGPLTRTLLKVIWPMVFSSQIELLVGLILLFWIGRITGTNGLEIFVLLSPPLRVFSLLVAGTLSAGMGALVAQSIGAKHGNGISILRSTLRLAMILTAAVVLPALLLSGPITDAFAEGAITAPDLRKFYIPWMIGFPLLLVADLFLDTILATGWTTFGLARVLMDLAFVFLITPVLMDWLHLGLIGAPIAAAASHAVLVVLIWRALKGKAETLGLGPIHARDPSQDRPRWRKVVEIGLPPQLGRISMFVAQSIYVTLLAHESSASVAGFGLAFNAILFVGLTGLSVAGGGAIMIGQNMGAGRPDRSIGVLVRVLVIMSMVLTLFIVATPFLRPVFEIFSKDAAVVDAAHHALKIMAWGQIGVAVFQVLIASFTAVGATKAAGFFVIVSEAVGVVFVFSYGGSVLDAVAYAYCISAAIKAVMLVALIPNSLIRPLVQAKHKREAAAAA